LLKFRQKGGENCFAGGIVPFGKSRRSIFDWNAGVLSFWWLEVAIVCQNLGKKAAKIALLAGFSFSGSRVGQYLTGMLAFCRFGGLKWPSFAKI
jgi:hypothetical protein